MKKNQIKNLKKLAKYLYNLPDDYSHFDMGTYCENYWSYYYEVTEVSKETYSECGTVACALGHGIAAGVEPYKNVVNWGSYSYENFGLQGGSNEFAWCFCGSWETYDNTPKGAAKRIMYMLEHGVPECFYADFDFGKSLEVYKDYVPVFED